jgi:hypothetical protein
MLLLDSLILEKFLTRVSFDGFHPQYAVFHFSFVFFIIDLRYKYCIVK